MFTFLLGLGITLPWIIAAEVLLIMVCVALEKEWAATVSILLFALAAKFLSGVAIWEVIAQNGPFFAKVLGAYLVIGVAWMYLKWFFFVRKVKVAYGEFLKEARVELTGKENDELALKKARSGSNEVVQKTPEELNAFEVKVAKEAQYDLKRQYEVSVPPLVSEKKADIIGWISYWPWSVLWTLFDDFVTKLFQHIYSMLAGSLQKISNRQFQEFNKS